MRAMWPFTKKSDRTAKEEAPQKRRGAFLTHGSNTKLDQAALAALANALAAQPAAQAMDAACGAKAGLAAERAGLAIPEAVAAWYANQRFIGHQMCAVLAQHWLVDKACTMPAEDAFRHGFEYQVYGGDKALDQEEQTDIDEALKRADRKFSLAENLVDFVRFGRIFGIRIVLFKVDNPDPQYYELPFNIDSVTPGTYRGMVQVDPYWCSPLLSIEAASDPTSKDFYCPEWWVIGGKKYHKTHLAIYRCGEVADVLKPMYLYGGVSVPQRIYERIYAAERTANEAPQLAMTKRTMVQNTDLTAIYENPDEMAAHMEHWAYYRDNYGIKLADTDDTISQHDTSLADLDAVIMSQYQIVSAIAGVPAVKLLGTTPKGFNATGEFESDSYHETLESEQAKATALVNRHHAMVLRSEVLPELPEVAADTRIEIEWNPVSTQTAKEQAEVNKLKSETDEKLLALGAIDAEDVRARLRSDDNSGYTDLTAEADMTTLPEDDSLESMMNGEESPEGPAIGNAETVGITAE